MLKTKQVGRESCEKMCFKLLCEVLVAGGYSTITLGTALKDVQKDERAGITMLFYGVLEKSIQFDYIIEKLAEKPPQKSVAVLIKMGLYLLRYTSTPDYAAINKIVNLAKEVGKSGVSGFINALLRKSVHLEIPKNNLSVSLSYPEWVIRKLQKRYDDDFIVQMLCRQDDTFMHIRRNGLKISKDEFEKRLGLRDGNSATSRESARDDSVQRGENINVIAISGDCVPQDMLLKCGGKRVTFDGRECAQKNDKSEDCCPFSAQNTTAPGSKKPCGDKKNFVARSADGAAFSGGIAGELTGTDKLLGAYKPKNTVLGYLVDSVQIEMLHNDDFTVQSLSSMLAVRAYLSGETPKNVMDLCSAPGGKAIYLKELSPKTRVVCCDIHPHRIELIKKYAWRMGTDVECFCRDATDFNPEWAMAFDLVICDVPCSGFGVKSKPDILLNRKESDLKSLAQIQLAILQNASKYVRGGGVLCYSTCTIFREENEEIIENFLAQNSNFSLAAIRDKYIESDSGIKNIYPQEYGSDGFFIARLRRKD